MEETTERKKGKKAFLIIGFLTAALLIILIATADFQDGNHIDPGTPDSYSFSEGDSIVVVEDPSMVDEVQEERDSLEELERELEITELENKADELKKRPSSDWHNLSKEEKYTVIMAELSYRDFNFNMSASQLFNCMNHKVDNNEWKSGDDIETVLMKCVSHGIWKDVSSEPEFKALAY